MMNRLDTCTDMRDCNYVVSWLNAAFKNEGERVEFFTPKIDRARSLFDAIDVHLEPELHIVKTKTATMEEWILIARREPKGF